MQTIEQQINYFRLMIPSYSELTDEQIEQRIRIVQSIYPKEFFKNKMIVPDAED